MKTDGHLAKFTNPKAENQIGSFGFAAREKLASSFLLFDPICDLHRFRLSALLFLAVMLV